MQLFVASRNTSAEEINKILTEESQTNRYRLVLCVSDELLVPSDIIQSHFVAIVDLEITRVVDGGLVKYWPVTIMNGDLQTR